MQQLAEPALQPPVAEVRLERLPPAAWPAWTCHCSRSSTPHAGAMGSRARLADGFTGSIPCRATRPIGGSWAILSPSGSSSSRPLAWTGTDWPEGTGWPLAGVGAGRLACLM
jgi:hypothetical protein